MRAKDLGLKIEWLQNIDAPNNLIGSLILYL